MNTNLLISALLLGSLTLSSFNANAQEDDSIEFGLKMAYQRYANHMHSPDTFAYGFFANKTIDKRFSIEAGLLSLGEGVEANGNRGGFYLAEFSALYDVVGEGGLFLKAGIAPWAGYLTTPKKQTDYDYGFSPVLGAGYQFPLFDDWSGRLEYQFISELGKDNTGTANSHLLSFSLVCCGAPNRDDYRAAKSVQYPDPQEVERVRAFTQAGAVTAVKNTREPALVLRSEHEVFGSWYFNTNSSQLRLSYPMAAIDRAREFIAKGCELKATTINGYADGVGGAKYNVWLAERRALNVQDYLTKALGGSLGRLNALSSGYDRADVNLAPIANLFERRVDYVFTFQCQKQFN
ncbi:OmpA family protein [Shewanella sp. Isolate13]|uniref:OmpA family protein n=1 Tax=Shewanella sp. Isolate13 TaxID=2908531 RepID=UPI001EFC6D7D|nr:OmpA family protein [Shewanella sp. Isolate13]MCG9731122.1 OmpA family protein [Shewanella sp. Isolate13]